ncbi:MAG: zinc-dependent metalloprotease family protein [Planctomycetota bacterium]
MVLLLVASSVMLSAVEESEAKAAEDSGKGQDHPYYRNKKFKEREPGDAYRFKVLIMKDPKLDDRFDGGAAALSEHVRYLIEGVDRRYRALCEGLEKCVRVEIAGQFYATESQRKEYERISAENPKRPKDAIRNWLRDWQARNSKFTRRFKYDALVLLRDAAEAAGSSFINTFDSKKDNVFMVNMGEVGPDANCATRAGLFTHELGHTFGLGHVRWKGRIMHPKVNPGSKWGRISINAFKKKVMDSGRLDFEVGTPAEE